MDKTLKSISSFLLNTFNPSTPIASRFDYVVGIIFASFSWLLIHLFADAVRMDENCEAQYDMFCAVKAGIGNGLLSVLIFGLYGILAISMLTLIARRLRVIRSPSLVSLLITAITLAVLQEYVFIPLILLTLLSKEVDEAKE